MKDEGILVLGGSKKKSLAQMEQEQNDRERFEKEVYPGYLRGCRTVGLVPKPVAEVYKSGIGGELPISSRRGGI